MPASQAVLVANPTRTASFTSILPSFLWFPLLPPFLVILGLLITRRKVVVQAFVSSFFLFLFPILDLSIHYFCFRPFVPVLLFPLLSILSWFLTLTIIFQLVSFGVRNIAVFLELSFLAIDFGPLRDLADPDVWQFSDELLHTADDFSATIVDYSQSVNMDMLSSANFSDFIIPSHLPATFIPQVDQLTVASHELATRLNFSQLVIEGRLPPKLRLAALNVTSALKDLYEVSGITNIIASRPAQDAWATVRGVWEEPVSVLPIALGRHPLMLARTAPTYVFHRWMPSPFPFFFTLSVSVFLVIVLWARGLCIECIKKWMTRRFAEKEMRDRTEDLHGWLLSGCAVAAGVGLAEATLTLVVCGLLYSMHWNGAKLGLHAMCFVAMQVCMQVREMERLLHGESSLSIVVKWAGLHAAVGVWWIVVLAAPMFVKWRWDIVVDLVVVAGMAFWARRAARRILRQKPRTD